MKPQLKSSPAARELIQRFEPFREIAAQGSDGRWRVGFGHRAAARDGVQVSRDDASLLLIYDVMQAEAAIDEMFPAPLPKLQRDALTSFVHDIGAAAFRNSDVARYLFEGRVEAAAEALASFGDGMVERREAESAMLLAGLDHAQGGSAPPRKPALVDLVIKVEHPADQPVAAPVRPRAALPDSIMPPPPPPLTSRQAAGRREAESEIARILATVGAMPLEDEAAQPETVSGESGAEPAAEAVIEPIAAPMAASVVEPVEAPAEPDEAEPVDDLTAGATDAGSTAHESSSDEGIADEFGADESGADESGADESGALPDSEADADAALEPVAEPDEAGPGASIAEPVSAQVMARMSQEIAQVQTSTTAREDEPGLPATGDDILREGISLGYAFTGSKQFSLQPEAEAGPDADSRLDAAPDASAVPGLEAQAEIGASPASEAVERQSDDIQTSGTDTEAAPEVDPEGAPDVAPAVAPEVDTGAATVGIVPAAAAIVERTLAVAGDRTPPPHPADEPALSEGAVGDIAGEGDRTSTGADHIAHLDDLAGAPDALMAGSDEEDPFSPSDLVGNADTFIETKPAEARKGEDGWGFVVTLIAGLVVTGAGILDIYGDWPRVWVEREPTWGVLAAVAGGFLVLTASWMLGSVLAAKRRQKRDS